MNEITLDKNNIPKHIAIIMDGNGRWAKQRSMPRVYGHNEGMKAMKKIVRHSKDLGVEYLTVYAFSTENWKRPKDEVSGIFKLLIKYVEQDLAELCENGVRIRVLGDVSVIPSESRDAIEKAVRETEGNSSLNFNIALNYGGRAELVRAVKQIAAEGIPSDEIDESTIAERLYTSNMPDPDLIIRTGGESRISNFLIWQGSYSEFVVSDCFWPDFTPEEYEKAICVFQGRSRRYGGL